jgi:DNA recombination protein RmuC
MQAILILVGLVVGGVIGGVVMARLERARGGGEIAALAAKLEASESLAGAREELVALVKQGAGEEIALRGDDIIKHVKSTLDAALKQTGANDEERQRALSGLVEPFTQNLKQMKERLDKVDEAREKTATDLSAQLARVTAGQDAVARSASSLERALRQPQVRGRWGELALRRLAELAGMSVMCDFVEQPQVRDDGRALRPDMLIKLPGGRLAVVDAKVPFALFLDAMQASDEAERVSILKKYARGVRGHVRNLADKSYAAQFSAAPDFVFMFLPSDHFLGAALEVDGELLEYALSQRVHLATPTTLITLLKSASYGFQEEKMAEDTRAIAELGRELYERIGKLLAYIDDVSRRINALITAQDALVGSVDRRVLPSARKLAELVVPGTDEQLPEIRALEGNARRVQAPELPGVDGDVRELPAPLPPAEEAA